jgi:hypothetical protein
MDQFVLEYIVNMDGICMLLEMAAEMQLTVDQNTCSYEIL